MKVLALGATGGTGRLIVRDALASHSVVVLVRSKARALDPHKRATMRTITNHTILWTM